MKSIKKGIILIWLIINVTLIIATLIVFNSTQEISYLAFCVTINITTAISLVPLFRTVKS